MTHTIEGVVAGSRVEKPFHLNLLTTVAKVLLDEGQEIPYVNFDGRGPHEIHVRGRHILGGQRIRVGYDCCAGVLWARRYELLDREGNVFHSDTSVED